MVVLPCGAMSTPHARQYSAISERLWANAGSRSTITGVGRSESVHPRPAIVADGHRPSTAGKPFVPTSIRGVSMRASVAAGSWWR